MTPLGTYTASLIAKHGVADNTHLYTFRILEGGFNFIPGQYIIINIPTQQGIVKRLYSLASPTSSLPHFSLLIKSVEGGVATNHIGKLLFGDVISFSGPAGQFYYHPNTQKEAIFLATGTGYAPIRSILQTHLSQFEKKTSLFWGVPTLKDMGLFDELLLFRKSFPYFSFYIYLSRETSLEIIPAQLRNFFRIGRISNLFEGVTDKEMGEKDYYFCGSRDVVESLRLLFLSKNVDSSLLHFEKY